MAVGAIRWLARLVLTGLLIGSLVLAGTNMAALARAPAGAALVERGSEGIAAATERALLVHATPEVVAARLDALLIEEPRNWLAIDAVEALAADRAIPLPADLLARRAAAWEADSGFLTSAENCGACIWDATACDMSTVLMCRAPVDLSPIGDVAGVFRAIGAYVAGRDVDEVDAILSVIGLTAVALAVSTGGSSLAIKTGAGLAKLAKSMKRLPDALTRPLVRAFREGLDTSRFSEAVRNRDLMRLFRPEALRPAAIIVEDAGRLVGNTSALGALHLMKFVDDPADLSRLTRVSDALGTRTVGAVEVLGKARLMRLSMRVADEVWFVFSGLIGAVAALLGLLQSLFGSMLLRVLRRMARAPGAR